MSESLVPEVAAHLRPEGAPNLDREPVEWHGAPSRRAILTWAALAAGGGAARVAGGAPPQEPYDVSPSSLLSRLVARCTMGVTPEEMALATSLGYEGYLEYHLAYDQIDDSVLDAILADPVRFSTLGMTFEQMLPFATLLPTFECIEAAVFRCVKSKRQLFERTVEMWTDHFNIDTSDEHLSRFKPIDDREVVRRYAMATFGELLDASAHSPAMLYYLNNDISVAGSPNENYARELMELHTLGASGGYTQYDVIDVARCFTGWGVYPDNAGPLAGTFRYNPGVHDTGEKWVLGHHIPARSAAAGYQDGLDVIAILRDHPSTAAFVAGKICRWFLGYDVPRTVLDAVAETYRTTGGDIRAMIRRALRPNQLATASPKLKRPWHLFMSAMRSVPTVIAATSVLRSRLLEAGQLRFAWPTPDGYPDNVDYWGGGLMSRWNFGADLLYNGITGLTTDISTMFVGATTQAQVMDRVNASLFGGDMAQAEVDRLGVYLQPAPGSPTSQREVLGLTIGAPSFQWY